MSFIILSILLSNDFQILLSTINYSKILARIDILLYLVFVLWRKTVQ